MKHKIFGVGVSGCGLLMAAAAMAGTAPKGGPTPVSSAGKGAIYTDSLQNGWQSWPWAKKVVLTNSKPVHAGKASILVVSGKWDALSVNHKPSVSTVGLSALSFWIEANGSAPQVIKITGLLDSKPQKSFIVNTIAQSTWTHVTVPLSSLGVAGKPNLSGLWFQDASGKGISFVIDDISLK